MQHNIKVFHNKPDDSKNDARIGMQIHFGVHHITMDQDWLYYYFNPVCSC